MKNLFKTSIACIAILTTFIFFSACRKDNTNSMEITEFNWKVLSVNIEGNISKPVDKSPLRGEDIAYVLKFYSDTFQLATNVNFAGGKFLIPERGKIQTNNYSEWTKVYTTKENNEFNDKLIRAVDATDTYVVLGNVLYFYGKNTEVKFRKQK